MKKQLLVLGLLLVAANIEASSQQNQPSSPQNSTTYAPQYLADAIEMAENTLEDIVRVTMSNRISLNSLLVSNGYYQKQINEALGVFDSSLTREGLISTYMTVLKYPRNAAIKKYNSVMNSIGKILSKN